MDEADPTFSAQDVVTVQRELRRRVGQGQESFTVPAFIGMISDEIDTCRAAGVSDADVADVIRSATGRAIEPADITRLYAPPEARQEHEQSS